ncbi:MAG: phosphoribosylaminoimidazolesuccinocarboxamide synthase [Cryomorphaceae bacterium]|nr:phosphoribosylaminoimidazolesuccinocarboxamide synthase [Cryomorphaceae bacterium]MBT3503352.1 phosphoribosylaminoimidazolesuccinocarboxamide synthase [Cryomorphaceae bacterium]MBT3688505.1 phosphoribosylaminoimidazolesuccinocarboxamide synthase [Cryomorphaceae bacterium]MBT4221999.1 phosphoribosylaminoimidazolesuccinocarboxamide synthase [Cryomorphaceae bacterium]MBT4294001.1 phosphoribosylaminoimidazolesuccinocarboxamide synthase [Cryomorphaceae bacterium]
MNSIYKTDFNFPGQTSKYEGKVRDVYTIEDDILVVIASDRISAFDIIMPRPIPNKGQILNQISLEMLNSTQDIIDNWLISSPDPNVSIGRKLNPIKIEMVIRGYLSGHSDRVYKSGKRSICGVKLSDGLVSNQKFDTPIITPSTKADQGHDEDISKLQILKQKILSIDQYEEIEQITYKLFKRGTEIAKKRGLILVDTKYEFGYDSNNKLYLIDEIHTPDSSRYFYMDSYNESIDNGLSPKQLSKEFFRQWLIENNFQGKENQNLPKITDKIVNDVSNRYIELYNQILGLKFNKSNNTNSINQIEKNIIKGLETL